MASRISSACDEALGRVELAQLGERFGLLGILRIEVVAHGLAAGRHQVILRSVDRDAIEPGVERAIAAERRRRAVRLEERFLRNVEGFGRSRERTA